MHRSRLSGFIIDCQTSQVEKAGQFWSAALGMDTRVEADARYVGLEALDRDIHIEVQRVDHESRVHVDLETDDLEAEVARLERLGAKKLEQNHKGSWIVMQAPTGQIFCVVPRKDWGERPGTTVWP